MDDPGVSYLTIESALTAAREAVNAFWEGRAAAGLPQDEEPLTHCLLTTAHPRVRCVAFSRQEEHSLGADWLWWFHDSTGEAFGMLVQAKALKQRGRRHHLGIDYASSGRRQITSLMNAADALDVPAVYVIYMGPADERSSYVCGRGHGSPQCDRCERLSVSVIPALLVRNLLSDNQWVDNLVEDLLKNSEPLEDIAMPKRGSMPLSMFYRRLGWDDELLDFLFTPQVGSRAVAQAITRHVLATRFGSFALATRDLMYGYEHVFNAIPRDTGHFGLPYLDHLLRGLRPQLPDYVFEAFDRGRPPLNTQGGPLAGIVVVDLGTPAPLTDPE